MECPVQWSVKFAINGSRVSTPSQPSLHSRVLTL